MEVRNAGEKGQGVFAKELVKKGEHFHIPDGVIRTNKEIEAAGQRGYDLCFQIDENHCLCPKDFDHPSAEWLTNHSCDPNTASLLSIHESVTLQDILPGEEVTIDYGTFDDDPNYSMECLCGAKNCRGVITGNDWKLPELQEKYRGYFQKNIQDKIDSRFYG